MAGKPWDRQDHDTDRSYAAFVVYRDLQVPERSLRRCADLYYATRNKGKESTLSQRNVVERWSTKHNWQVRVRAWDAHLEEQKRAKSAEETLKMHERHTNIARVMQNKLIEYLNALKPEQLTPSIAARWLEVSARLESVSRESFSQKLEPVEEEAGDVQERVVKLILEGRLPDSVVSALADATIDDVERILSEQAGHIPEVKALLSEAT